MIPRVYHRAGLTLGWAILIFTLLLPSLLGSLAAIVAVVLSLIATPILLLPGAGNILRAQPAPLIFVAVFLALALCYAITARDPGNLLYLASFLGLLTAPTVYVLAARPGLDRNPALLIAAFCAVGAAIAALVAVNDVLLRGLPRAAGFLMGGNLLARLAVTLGFVGLAGLFVTRSPFRYLLYLGPVLALIVLLLSGTRGAVLAIPVCLIVVAAFLLGDRRDRPQLWVLVALAVALAGLILLSGRFASLGTIFGDVLDSGVSATDSSTNERLTMLHAAFEAFLNSPWFGYGWANLAPAAALGMDMTPYGGAAPGGEFQFHSDLGNFAVAAGIVGIVCWLALLAAPIIGALATPRDGMFRARLFACVQLSASYAVYGLTDLNFGYDLPTTLYAFLTAIVLGAFRERPAVQPGR